MGFWKLHTNNFKFFPWVTTLFHKDLIFNFVQHNQRNNWTQRWSLYKNNQYYLDNNRDFRLAKSCFTSWTSWGTDGSSVWFWVNCSTSILTLFIDSLISFIDFWRFWSSSSTGSLSLSGFPKRKGSMNFWKTFDHNNSQLYF